MFVLPFLHSLFMVPPYQHEPTPTHIARITSANISTNSGNSTTNTDKRAIRSKAASQSQTEHSLPPPPLLEREQKLQTYIVHTNTTAQTSNNGIRHLIIQHSLDATPQRELSEERYSACVVRLIETPPLWNVSTNTLSPYHQLFASKQSVLTAEITQVADGCIYRIYA